MVTLWEGKIVDAGDSVDGRKRSFEQACVKDGIAEEGISPALLE